MKVKIKRNIERVDEIDLPKFHTTFFRNQYFDGEKIHSFNFEGEYMWLNTDADHIFISADKIKPSDKKTFIGIIDKTIDNLNQLKQKVENENE